MKTIADILDKQHAHELLNESWCVVKNGTQLDIHVRSKIEDREYGIACDVRNREIAELIASAPRLKQALLAIIECGPKYADGDKITNPLADKMAQLAAQALYESEAQD